MFRGGDFAAFARSPSRFVDLPAAGDAQAVRRNIFRDCGTGGDVGAIADAKRGHECRVTADKYSFADICRVFLEAIVVAGYRAGSDVRLWANVRVAKISQVRNFRALPN